MTQQDPQAPEDDSIPDAELSEVAGGAWSEIDEILDTIADYSENAVVRPGSA